MKSLSQEIMKMTSLLFVLVFLTEQRCMRVGEDGNDVIITDDCATDPESPARDQQQNSDRQRIRQQYQTRERAKQTRIFLIQQQIWERLGMGPGRRPAAGRSSEMRPNATQLSPRELMAYESALRRTEQLNERAPERVLQPSEYFAKIYQALKPSCRQQQSWQQEGEEQGSGSRMTFRLYFDLDLPNLERPRRTNRELKVEKADLMLRRKSLGNNEGIRTNSERRMELVIYSYAKPVRSSRRDSKRVVARQSLRAADQGGEWVTVDIREILEDWLKRPTRNYGLVVSVIEASSRNEIDAFTVFQYNDCNSTRQPVLLNIPTEEDLELSNETPRGLDSDDTVTDDAIDEIVVDDEITSPYLKLTTAEVPRAQSSVRQRRESEANKPPRSATCVMEKITVSLGELGFSDRVIIPQVFETAYCRGYCPIIPQIPRSGAFMPFLQNGLQNQNSDVGIHACCSPTKLKPLNILQSADRGLFITTLDDVIVTECGCRV